MNDVYEFLGNVSNLSSDGLFGYLFEFAKISGDWADAVAKILGLAG